MAPPTHVLGAILPASLAVSSTSSNGEKETRYFPNALAAMRRMKATTWSVATNCGMWPMPSRSLEIEAGDLVLHRQPVRLVRQHPVGRAEQDADRDLDLAIALGRAASCRRRARQDRSTSRRNGSAATRTAAAGDRIVGRHRLRSENEIKGLRRRLQAHSGWRWSARSASAAKVLRCGAARIPARSCRCSACRAPAAPAPKSFRDARWRSPAPPCRPANARPAAASPARACR